MNDKQALGQPEMSAALMLQGTASGVGKTTVVAALGRALARRGVSVAPFKPQNMALNSAVSADGGEIGRAQAMQAAACRIPPLTAMNPVLLKPLSDTGAQVIVNGRPAGNMNAAEYHAYKPQALAAVLEAWSSLREQFDFVLVEGAGSPAEVNLREGDIANMGFAEAANCPVVLVADIDKGGVFAQLLGTLECLSVGERERVRGFIINKFRGDPGLLQPGLTWLEQKTGKPVFGVLPYRHGLALDEEDAIDTLQVRQPALPGIRVAVPVLPRISNHTDFDALRGHPQVELMMVSPGRLPDSADLIVIPGSKHVAADLQWLRAEGWDNAIRRHLRYGGKVIGICGGLQMLGEAINDPRGIEGPAGSARGLGLLDITSTLREDKRLRERRGTLSCLPASAAVSGYEIHHGESCGAGFERPAIGFDDGSSEGLISDDGQIIGTYLHGLFDEPAALAAVLDWCGLRNALPYDRDAAREAAFEQLADDVDQALSMGPLLPPHAFAAPPRRAR